MGSCPWPSPVSMHRPKFTNYPVVLSHVCRAWRNVAIGTTFFWTHIDLDPSLFHEGQPSPKAKAYLARAGNRSLDVHAMTIAHGSHRDSTPTIIEKNDFIRFLETMSPRARSITVAIPDGGPVLDFCQLTTSAALRTCVPGVLTRLLIEVLEQNFSLINPQTSPEQSVAALEAIGHPDTVLGLCNNYFPQWTSKMYHGLTQLRLKGRRQSISKTVLTGILSSSPKLCVLEIGIRIIDSDSHLRTTPVRLTDLELLISSVPVPCNEIPLFSMIQPGQKSLTFSMHGSLIASILSYNFTRNDHAIERFFACANIARLIIYALSDYDDLAKLLPFTPNIQILALDYPFETRASLDETILPAAATLSTLYVTITPYSVPYVWPALEQVIRRHGARNIIWWASRAEGGVPDDLFSLCHQVTIVSHEEPNPIQKFLNLNHLSLC